MTEETLKKANDYKMQIEQLKSFVYTCESCWHKLRIRRETYELITAHGYLRNEIEVNRELAEKILKVINDYISYLERELEEL